jgi:hypothetical protein
VPNGTPPELERFVDNPEALIEHVQGLLSRAQEYQDQEIELLDVYFEVGRPMAHVFVRNLDDPLSVKAVCRILHAEGVTELLTAEQVRTAIERQGTIDPGPDTKSTS